MHLERTLRTWGTPAFEETLKQELLQNLSRLPLQQGLSTGNYVADGPVQIVIHKMSEADDAIRVRAGIFYQGILGGCSCADDPSPSGESDEYCEVLVELDRSTAMAIITLQEE